jgi:potassium/hydrogen antiporter
VHLTTVGLYPALTLAVAFLSYGAATLVEGSGFLAVYVTAVVLGASQSIPYRSGSARVHDALAWLAQITMFVMLGLLVFPSQLLPVAGLGLSLALFLAFVARPLAVIPCLLPFGYRWIEVAYLGWNGLRGAVPIILATFPVLAQVPGSERIFNIVFFIVVVSSLVPGATIRFVTRRLRLDVPERPLPPAVLEINSSHRLNGQLASFFMEPSAIVCGAALREIEFPPNSSVVMIVRGLDVIAARGETVIQPGDHVYVFYRPEDRPLIELLFGRPEEGVE